MRVVIQRVQSAAVTIDGDRVALIGKGLAILLGVEKGDQTSDADFLAEKIANLRVFEDSEGKMNLSVLDAGGEALVVSQFTLLADCRKGRRPSFDRAAAPNEAEALYNGFVEKLRACGVPVHTGKFQARMLFQIENDGPVTVMLDSRDQHSPNTA